MGYIDIQASLLTYLYNLLTADETLPSSMGGDVRLYLTWANSDTEFPYLVQRIDIRAEGETYAVRKGTYYLDIWSSSSNADETLAIRKRVIELLDELNFSTDEIPTAHLELQTDGFVPETTEEIYHYAFQFNLIFTRKSESETIDGR